MGSARELDTAEAGFKAAWEALKARTTPEQLAAAYKAMNIRDDGVTLYKFSTARRRPGALPGDWRMTDDDENSPGMARLRTLLADVMSA
jgi:hypothetical protein